MKGKMMVDLNMIMLTPDEAQSRFAPVNEGSVFQLVTDNQDVALKNVPAKQSMVYESPFVPALVIFSILMIGLIVVLLRRKNK